MRIALLGDVHGNVPALEAVLAAIATTQHDTRLCLGDTVGYNAQPRECIARLRSEGFSFVMGNHDHDVGHGLRRTGTNSLAKRLMEWTSTQLDDAERAFLRDQPQVVVSPLGFTAVHGCFLDEPARLVGYVTPGSLRMNLRALINNTAWPKVGFCGHTHVPIFGYMENDVCEERALTPGKIVSWPSDAQAVLLNPGSVGQPRDGDPRAAFAVVDLRERTVEIFRVHYDIDAAVAAIAAAGLPPEVGTRLFEAR